MAVIEAHSLIMNPTVQQDLLNYTEAICSGLPTYAAECKVGDVPNLEKKIPCSGKDSPHSQLHSLGMRA